MTYGPAPGDDDQQTTYVEHLGGSPETYLCEPPSELPLKRPIRGFAAPGRHRRPVPACTCPQRCPAHPERGSHD